MGAGGSRAASKVWAPALSRANKCFGMEPSAGEDPARPVQADDFIIERVIGRGAYGVVVLVRTRVPESGSERLPHMGSQVTVGSVATQGSKAYVRYAMKMQNTDARSKRTPLTDVLPSRATSAAREKEIMRNLDHPFIIHVAYFFELDESREWKDTSTGTPVTDNNGNKQFHQAIVMEFVNGGDLESYVFKRSPPVGGPSERQQKIAQANEALRKQKGGKRRSQQEEPPKPPASQAPTKEQQIQDGLLTDEAVDWVCLIRRWSAEMCVGLKFLHDKKIIYRDLKPQNVLLKRGSDEELHICFTDFGFSKQLGVPTAVSMSDRLTSLAGTELFAAPEVKRIQQTRRREEYTPAVDLYSLGRTVLVCLNRTRHPDYPEELMMPSPEQCAADPRVPPPAREFVARLTSEHPEDRGTSETLTTSPFFDAFEMAAVSNRNLPAIDWVDLEKRV